MIEERIDRCPDSETLARGAAGALPLSDRRALARHLSFCDGCTELVRLWPEVRAWADTAAEAVRPALRGKARSPVPIRYLLALAAALVVGVGLVSLRTQAPEGPPGFRTEAGPKISSLLPPDHPLPRNAFRLRWTPGPPDSRYAVLVAREDLAPIARAQGLAAPEFLVDESLLRELPAGTRIVWTVEASVPGSRPLRSLTFRATLE